MTSNQPDPNGLADLMQAMQVASDANLPVMPFTPPRPMPVPTGVRVHEVTVSTTTEPESL